MSSQETLSLLQFQQIASALLNRHYGLHLGDLGMNDSESVTEFLQSGLRPYEVIAEHAAKMDLERIDALEFYGLASKKAIVESDERHIIEDMKLHSVASIHP